MLACPNCLLTRLPPPRPFCLVGALAAHRIASHDRGSRARPAVTQSHSMVAWARARRKEGRAAAAGMSPCFLRPSPNNVRHRTRNKGMDSRTPGCGATRWAANTGVNRSVVTMRWGTPWRVADLLGASRSGTRGWGRGTSWSDGEGDGEGGDRRGACLGWCENGSCPRSGDLGAVLP
jgi:hypothetical protein